jgi:hypothetical protein
MSVPYFSADQDYWLENQLDNYCYCSGCEDLTEFWISVYEVFFDCWPERDCLFVGLLKTAPLSEEQHRQVNQAIEQRKKVGTAILAQAES